SSREPGRKTRSACSRATSSPSSASGGRAYQRASASSTRSAPRDPPAGVTGGSTELPRSAATRSPSRTATHAAIAAARAACTDLKRTRVPKYSAGEVSATTRVNRSRSAWNIFVCGRPLRAVTRQSIWRTSSPGAYSRDSAYSIPRPRTGDGARPAPASRPCLGGRRAAATARSAVSSASVGTTPSPGASGVATGLGTGAEALATDLRLSGQRHFLQQLVHQAVAVPAFGGGFIGGQHPVAQHVRRDRVHVLGGDVVAARQPGAGARAPLQGDRATRAGAPGDAARQVGVIAARIARGQHQFNQIALQLRRQVDVEHGGTGGKHIGLGDALRRRAFRGHIIPGALAGQAQDFGFGRRVGI